MKAINALIVREEQTLPDGVKVLIVSCNDYNAFIKLPKVVEYEGIVYGCTGWNSDNCNGYYRNDVKVAFSKGYNFFGA